MINKYLGDYYTNGITARRIVGLEGVSKHKIGYMFRGNIATFLSI